MSNRLYLAGVGSAPDITIEAYPSDIKFPVGLQLNYIPTLDASINIQRRVSDDREIKLVFDAVKYREAITIGTSVSGGSTTVFNTNLSMYTNDSFNNYWIKFTSGPNNGTERRVSDFASANGQVTVSSAFGSAPGNDTFMIYRKAAWIDTLKSNRYVLTDYQFTLEQETEHDPSVLPEYAQRVLILDVLETIVANSLLEEIKDVVVILRKVNT